MKKESIELRFDAFFMGNNHKISRLFLRESIGKFQKLINFCNFKYIKTKIYVL
jgi:hypothetical protein